MRDIHERNRFRRAGVLGFGAVAIVAALSCRREPEAPGSAEPRAMTLPATGVGTGREHAAPHAETPPGNRTDSPVTPARINLDELRFQPGPPELPRGAEVAVLEGTPPFATGKSYLMVARMPKNYRVPPHVHLVTERVTVLRGSAYMAMGPTFGEKERKKLEQGAVAIVPGEHPHEFGTLEETYIQVQGVGPWAIHYLDPKDDPRQPPPPRPSPPAERSDSPVGAMHLGKDDAVQWTPVKALPPGAEMTVLEGTPPFKTGSFVFRVKLPDGYKVPPHHHLVTERVTVVSGRLGFGMGERWDDGTIKTIDVGGVALMPREHRHFIRADGETVVQLQGVGPWDIIYVNPEDDPRRK